MSGHSKWSQIKRQKGVADVKRSAVFSRLTNAIILAAKSGGDPSSNFSLKMAIERAKAENMPKENVDRAIKRGTGEIAGAKIEEVLYEAIGPLNLGILIEAATDNRNRTNAEIKSVLNKFNAKLAGNGAVLYQFNRMGKLLVEYLSEEKEEQVLKIIDSGAVDFEELDGIMTVYTKPNELKTVKENLESQGIIIKEANLSYEPKNMVKVEDRSESEKIIKLFESLENLSDVTNVYSNADFDKKLVV